MHKNRSKDEFEAFDAMMHKLIQVPHSEIKAKLEAEKMKKQEKRKLKAGKTKSQ